MEPTHMPDGLILESLKMPGRAPIIHVAMNYRLGCKTGTRQRLGDMLKSAHSLWFRPIRRAAR